MRIAGSAHAGRVEVRVIDRGPGLAAADVDRVFRPFQRTDDARRNGDGVGLGLAIARGLHRGDGRVGHREPTPGGGATFVVALREAVRP